MPQFIPAEKGRFLRPSARHPGVGSTKKLHLLVTIVNRNKTEFYIDLLQSLEINLQLSSLASGTASTETLRLLGLADSDKAVIFSVIRDDNIKPALELLEDKFQTVRGGKGVAYTIPLTGVIGVSIYQFLSNNRMTKEQK